MDPLDVTVGFPVSDLGRAVAWYRKVFGLGAPALEPVDGVVEFELGPIWLQLFEGDTERAGVQPVTSFGVTDAAAERRRLVELGVDVGPLEHVAGAVDYAEFADLDGNVLSIHSQTR